MKSYNPFKMWGAYIGAIIMLLVVKYIGFILKYSEFNKTCIESIASGSPGCMTVNFVNYLKFQSIVGIVIILVVGFLVGWGIHSLFAKGGEKEK